MQHSLSELIAFRLLQGPGRRGVAFYGPGDPYRDLAAGRDRDGDRPFWACAVVGPTVGPTIGGFSGRTFHLALDLLCKRTGGGGVAAFCVVTFCAGIATIRQRETDRLVGDTFSGHRRRQLTDCAGKRGDGRLVCHSLYYHTYFYYYRFRHCVPLAGAEHRSSGGELSHPEEPKLCGRHRHVLCAGFCVIWVGLYLSGILSESVGF